MSETAFSWSKKHTMLQVELCIQHKNDLSYPGKEKKNVWRETANKTAIKGVNIPWANCE